LFLLAARLGHPDGRRDLRPALALTGLVLALAYGHPGWDAARLTFGAHYYWQSWPVPPPPPPGFLREDAQSGFISVDRLANGVKVLKTNGKYEGNDAPGEFQDHFALMGALYVRGFDRAALVGLGPGRTLSLIYAMPFGKIDVAEFSPAIVDAAVREFPTFVAEPFADAERVRLIQDDGRNFLQVSPFDYDFVAVGITGAAFAGVGNLYTTQFFETVRSRLRPRGIFLLWIQVHHVLAREVRSVLYTLRRVFPHVHFYATQGGDQGFLVASPGPLEIDGESIDRLSRAPAIRRTLDRSGLRSLADLAVLNVFNTDEELGAYLAGGMRPREGAVLLTDANPAFEYATPRGLAERIAGFDFQAYSAKKLPRFDPPLSPGDEAGLQGLRYLVAGDGERALPQLERAQALLGTDVWSPQIKFLQSLRDPAAAAAP
jgi:spermidine synthase